jgi:hypothetical protein
MFGYFNRPRRIHHRNYNYVDTANIIVLRVGGGAVNRGKIYVSQSEKVKMNCIF